MKKRFHILLATFFSVMLLTACGEDPELTKFRKNVDDFCDKLSQIHIAINSIDATKDSAVDELLDNLDELDLVFQAFAKLDFPEEFDNLEPIADESSQYMTTAVENFHLAYSNDSYNEYTAEYAQQNYARAYKRIQIIISFLHGETPDDVNLAVEPEE